jgi:hypothetical protein
MFEVEWDLRLISFGFRILCKVGRGGGAINAFTKLSKKVLSKIIAYKSLLIFMDAVWIIFLLTNSTIARLLVSKSNLLNESMKRRSLAKPLK